MGLEPTISAVTGRRLTLLDHRAISTPGGIRTHTALILSQMSLAVGLLEHMIDGATLLTYTDVYHALSYFLP